MRLRTVVLRVVLVLTVLAAVLAAGLHWASRSEVVLHWAVDRVAAQLPGKLMVSGLSGALVRPITIERLQYEQDGLRIVASEVAIDWSAWVLVLADRVWIRRLTAGAVTVESRSQGAAPPALPQHLRLPLAVRIDRLEVSTLRAEIDGRAVELSTIALAYEGNHRFHHLDLERVTSEWGALHGELGCGRSPIRPERDGETGFGGAARLAAGRAGCLGRHLGESRRDGRCRHARVEGVDASPPRAVHDLASAQYQTSERRRAIVEIDRWGAAGGTGAHAGGCPGGADASSMGNCARSIACRAAWMRNAFRCKR